MKRMSIDESAAEITGLKQLIGDLQLRNQATLADNAALRAALVRWIAADGSSVYSEEDEALAELAIQLKDDPADHPGAALLAELEAARGLADAVTAYFNTRGAEHANRAGNDDIAAMADALAAYGTAEQAVKARE